MSDDLNIHELVQQQSHGEAEPQTEEVETSEETSPKETTPEAEEVSEEPKIPLSRLRKEIERRKKLEQELESKHQSVQPVENPSAEDEKVKEAEQWIEQRVEALLTKREQEKIAQEAKEDAMLEDTLQEIRDVNPKLDEKGFLEFFTSHRFEDSVDGIWDAYKVYSERKQTKEEKPKPKMPSAIRTNDNVSSESVDTKKDLYTILGEAKRKHGLSS